jgi:hypothetical protein
MILEAFRTSIAVTQPAEKKEYWIDDRTKLMWPVKDNGRVLPGPLAIEWCKALRIGGFADWRQPSLDELLGIFNAEPLRRDVNRRPKIKGPIQLTEGIAGSMVWSATASTKYGATPGAWLLDFASGHQLELPISTFVAGGSALCVRQS